MRTAVFALAALQMLMFITLSFTATGGSDPAGNAMSAGFLGIAGMFMAILLVPALILAFVNRGLTIALILAIVSLVGAVFGLAAV